MRYLPILLFATVVGALASCVAHTADESQALKLEVSALRQRIDALETSVTLLEASPDEERGGCPHPICPDGTPSPKPIIKLKPKK